MKTAVKDAEGVEWGGVGGMGGMGGMGGVVRHNSRVPSPEHAVLIFCLACFRDIPTILAPGAGCIP